MKTHIRILTLAAFAAALTLTGCQTTPSGPSRAAVGCDKCKTVWVPTGAGGRMSGYSMAKGMACPDCTSAVENYVRTGELKHKCASCGTALKHCTTH